MAGLLTEPASHSPAIADLLRSIALFQGLDAESLADVCPTAEQFTLAAGQVLFAQNDPGDGAYLVGSGSLSVYGRTPGDGERLLTRVGPQEVVGEFCLLDGGRRSGEVRADEPVSGYRIDREKFAALRAGGRAVAFEVLRRLQQAVASRTRETIEEIAAVVAPAAAEPVSLQDRACTPAEPAQCQALLHAFPGFDGFRAEDWAPFAGLCGRFELARGDMVEPGVEPFGALYVIARGALRVRLPGAAPTQQLLIRGPGSLVGTAALVQGGDWPAMVDVREDAVIFALPAHAFAAICHPQSAMERRLFDMLGRQLTTDLRRISRVQTRVELASLVQASNALGSVG
ncbi:MAG: cyclic nucleotide-binding domain-containing protein [Erythrobacter sp.]|nr:cyclic nucleotide-binding domain-containing protein [Erythrobacter sp.]